MDMAEQFLHKINKMNNLYQLIDPKILTNTNKYVTCTKNSILLQLSGGCPEETMGARKSRK